MPVISQAKVQALGFDEPAEKTGPSVPSAQETFWPDAWLNAVDTPPDRKGQTQRHWAGRIASPMTNGQPDEARPEPERSQTTKEPSGPVPHTIA